MSESGNNKNDSSRSEESTAKALEEQESGAAAAAAKDGGDARLMVSRQLFAIPLRFAKTLFVIPLLTPETMFIVKLISTWLGYLPRLTFGVHKVLRAYYPEAETQQDEEKCRQYLVLAWRFSLGAGLIGAASGAFMSLRFFQGSYLPLLVLWGLGAVLNYHARQVFQARGVFVGVVRMDNYGILISFALSFAGVVAFGLEGYLYGLFSSVAVLVWLGRKTYFPPSVHLSLVFVKQSLISGSHMWLNGFMANLAKTFEITLFALGSDISRNFAGQYAVAMTLAGLMENVMTSMNSVFVRRTVVLLSAKDDSGDGAPDFRPLYGFIVFSFLVYVLVAGVTMMGSHLLIYLLPKYSTVPSLLPPLLLGTLLGLFRVYPCVVFRLHRQLWYNTLGNALHLIGVVVTFQVLAVYFASDPGKLAFAQPVGAGLGSFFVWLAFIRKKVKHKEGLMTTLVLALLGMVWMMACIWSTHLIVTNMVIIIVGMIVLATLTRVWFPEAVALLAETFVNPILRKLQKKRSTNE